MRGLFEIEFNPLRVTKIRGSELFGIYSVACVSKVDKIVISGYRRVDGTSEWGIFELYPADGSVRFVVRHEAPRPGANGEIWSDLSVSPDGNRAVAFRHKELDLIDLAKVQPRPWAPIWSRARGLQMAGGWR